MGIQYQQEDTVAPCGAVAACASEAVSTNAIARECVAGGTAGTGTPTAGTDAGGIPFGPDQMCLGFEFTPAAGDNWNAGLYTVPINVITGAGALRWLKTYVCRLNSACVNQETLGSLTPASPINMFTGVQQMQINGSAVASPGAGDKIYIACIMESAIIAVQVTVTPNQLISTPLTAGTQTICDPGRMILGGLSLTSTLFPRVRPQKPEVPLDIVIP